MDIKEKTEELKTTLEKDLELNNLDLLKELLKNNY